MSETFDTEAHADHMAAVMGLSIRPEWKEIVVRHLAATATAAELILSFPLDDHVEPAPVFEP